MVNRLRFAVLIGCFGLAYASLIFHLYNLQIVNGETYVAQAGSQIAASRVLNAQRGGIYFLDKNKNRLAAVSNRQMPLIYAVPSEISDAKEVANQIAPVLGLEVPSVEKLLSKEKDQYELLKKKAEREVATSIQDLGVKGIYVEENPERFYPFGDLASHVLGFVAPNNKDKGQSGRYGVEEFYDQDLIGVAGEMQGSKIVPPRAGEDVVLTIDPSVQTEAKRVLDSLIKKWNAKSGSVIVEDPKTGKILAMESSPSFDPNNYNKAEVANFLNPVTQQIYEPGSVFKVLTMAAGLDSHKVTPDMTFNDTGLLELNGKKIRNWDLQGHGTVTMSEIIEKSLNTGAAFVERKTGDATFKKYMEKFGFSEKTGVDLPGEVRGDIKQLRDDAPQIAFATASFGQGVAVTPLQLINAVAAIANGGELMRPYVTAEAEPKTVRRVMGEDAAKKVTKMMVSAVDKAEVARIKGYSIAGKTGTAQVPDLKRGGYKEAFINTYVGFGPTSDPKFIILIKLNEPEGAPLAGQTVVPAFRDLAQFMINYYNISPDRSESVIE